MCLLEAGGGRLPIVASDRVDLLEPGLSSASEPRDSDRRRSELEAPMFERFEEDPRKFDVEPRRLEDDPRTLLAPKLTSFLST